LLALSLLSGQQRWASPQGTALASKKRSLAQITNPEEGEDFKANLEDAIKAATKRFRHSHGMAGGHEDSSSSLGSALSQLSLTNGSALVEDKASAGPYKQG